MAARLNKRQAETTKDAIKSTALINRLQDHALGTVELMASSQITAALGLLKKTLPDLKVTELDLDNAQLTVNLVSQSGSKPTDDHS